MRGNVPIPQLPLDEEVWFIASITSVRESTARNGKRYFDATAQNSTGRIVVRIWQEAYDDLAPLRPGLWKLKGKSVSYQSHTHFVVSQYKPATLEEYRRFQVSDPAWPRAYTIDIETLALDRYRARVPKLLRRDYELGRMRIEQIERYVGDPEAEAERAFVLGSLSAISGRVISIAVHVAPLPEFLEFGGASREIVFGIDENGVEQAEPEALSAFLALMANFDREADELVGHNIIGFDLPFVFQRCLVNEVKVPPFVNLGEYSVRGVFDTMRRWWFGERRTVGLDDLAWAFDLESSKTDEVEGSKVYDLYRAGRLLEIREYNLNDVRLTRKLYERMVRVFGR